MKRLAFLLKGPQRMKAQQSYATRIPYLIFFLNIRGFPVTTYVVGPTQQKEGISIFRAKTLPRVPSAYLSTLV